MRPLRALLASSAALVGFVQAASLAELAAELPACGLTCLGTAIAASPCTLANSTCICTNTVLLQSAAACLATACKPKEQLQVAKIQQDGCGGPVESHQRQLRIIGHLFCSLAAVSILTRIWSKLKILHKLYPDDWVMIIAGVALIPFWIILIRIIDLGLGLNLWDTNLDTLDEFFKSFWVEEIIYINLLAITKVALLLFLLNVFPVQYLRATCWTLIALTVGIATSFTMVTIFSCSPIPYFWTRWQGEAGGKCNNINLQTYISAALNIAQDFAILFLPMPELYKLQVSRKKRIQLFLMFGVGLFVSITSIVRLKTLVKFGNTKNPSMDYTTLVIWSVIECNVAIICACMPSIRKLLGDCFKSSFFASTVKTNPSSSSATRSGDPRVYQSRSFKIESRLRSQHDDFHELVSMSGVTGGDYHLDHGSGKSNSLPKEEGQ
ncbi:hypothetical protein BKA65DRAFT_597041 [Rhexocercosporidium sp. MPI-PUGE-AT-0058]|nr:hypothetical protein BKA65DRAFT_597041 [Rhexocercosporidium sp. MPI-PUGE-AT-0058]